MSKDNYLIPPSHEPVVRWAIALTLELYVFTVVLPKGPPKWGDHTVEVIVWLIWMVLLLAIASTLVFDYVFHSLDELFDFLNRKVDEFFQG